MLLGAGVGVGVGAGIGLAAYPGYWPYGAYAYPYSHPYIYHNRTGRRNRTATSTSSSATATPTATNAARAVLNYRRDDGVDVTMNVTCLCAQYSVCGCDDNNNSTFLDSVIGDGTNLNTSIVNFANINGTQTVVLNGTLPNGTTAPGGTEDANPSSSSSSSSSAANMLRTIGGYWVMVVIVGCTAFLI